MVSARLLAAWACDVTLLWHVIDEYDLQHVVYLMTILQLMPPIDKNRHGSVSVARLDFCHSLRSLLYYGDSEYSICSLAWSRVQVIKLERKVVTVGYCSPYQYWLHAQLSSALSRTIAFIFTFASTMSRSCLSPSL